MLTQCSVVEQELEDFFAETSDEEILKLWNECAREEYEGTITVSEYMDAIGHMVEEPMVDRRWGSAERVRVRLEIPE